MRCPDCGFGYAESSPDDRRLHRRVHDETLKGLRRSGFNSCTAVWRSRPRSVIVINGQSPRVHRRLAQEVSLVAAGDVDFTNVAYHADEEPDDRQIHIFIGVEAERAKAYVSFERRFHVWQCTWDEYETGVVHRLSNQPMWSVGYAWVSRAHRRKGWVRTIVAAAANHLGFGSEFGWQTPFTEDGKAVVRALCPSGIFIAK